MAEIDCLDEVKKDKSNHATGFSFFS